MGKIFRAQPWIDDGDLHYGNSELLVSAALRYTLDLQPQHVPRQHSLASMCQSSLFYIRTLKDYMIYMAGSRSEVYRYMRYMYRSKLQVKPVNGTSTGWLRTSESWRFRPNRHDERRKGTRS